MPGTILQELAIYIRVKLYYLYLYLHNSRIPIITTFNSPSARWLSRKESASHCRQHKRREFHPWVRKICWSRKWQPTVVLLPGKFHGQSSWAGYCPWGHRTRLSLHFYLSEMAFNGKDAEICQTKKNTQARAKMTLISTHVTYGWPHELN